MTHGVTQQQWLDFMDGNLDAGRRREIQQHLELCPECYGDYLEMMAWGHAIESEASRLRDAIDRAEPGMDRLVQDALERIRAVGLEPCAAGPYTTSRSLFVLRTLLAPICGIGTARAAIQLARRDAGLLAGDRFGASEWRDFVAILSRTISQQCGIAAGRLIVSVGLGLGAGEP